MGPVRSKIWMAPLVLLAAVGCTTAGGSSTGTEASDAVDPEPTTAASPSPVGSADTGSADTGSADTGSADTGSADTGSADTGSADTGPDGSCSAAAGVQDFVVDAGGVERPVRVMVPSATTEPRLPVVIDWHGLGGDGPSQAAYSAYEDLGEQEGFVVVHPTGLPLEPGAPNSWQLFDEPSARDDLAFADALFERLEQDWCADPTRIYSTGFSNGGYFTSRLVCERADRIAAAVSVGGLYHSEGCSPARSVPFMAMHGTADPVVPYDGRDSILAGTDLAGPETTELLSRVIPDEFSLFAQGAGCTGEPERTTLSPEVVRHDYLDCENGVPMTFYELPGSGHTWPGSPYGDSAADASEYTDDIRATEDGWEFLRRHQLAGES
jgi:polyhydroxybutyrate depolymerase